MPARHVATALLLAALAAAAVLLWQAGEPTLAAPAVANAASPPAAANSAMAAEPVGVADSVPPSGASARAELPVDAGSPPVPADAQWIEIRISIAATGAPAAGADVAWVDASIWERAAARRQAWMSYDPERFAERHGWRARADDRGRVRVHLCDWTQVFARQGQLYGSLQCSGDTAPPPGGHRIELVADRSVELRVVDADGKPAAEVPIGVARHGKDGRLLNYLQYGPLTSSDDDGRARLPHLQEWRGTEVEETAVFRAVPFLPGRRGDGAAFDPAAPPPEPLLLQLPACGSIAVHAELGGRQLADSACYVQLRLAGDDRGGAEPPCWLPLAVDGTARFPFVPTGCDYELAADVDAAHLAASCRGPTAQGQVVDVALRFSEQQIVLTGRVLDDRRQPVGEATLQLRCESEALFASGALRTDAQGRFRFCMDEPEAAVGDYLLVVDWPREKEPTLRAEVRGSGLAPGVTELGDLALDAGPLLVAGRFTSGGKPYPRPVDFEVQRWNDGADGDEAGWSAVECRPTQTGDGRFEVHAEATGGRWRLLFLAWQHLPVPPVEFAPGTRDLAIEIAPGAKLTASMRLPPELAATPLLELIPEPGAAALPGDDRERFDRFTERPWSQDGRRYEAQWRALPPGRYRLEIRLFAPRRVLRTIDDVVVPPPEGGDPRLCDIDLTAELQVLTLRLADPDGRPLEASALTVPLPQQQTPWNAVDWYGPVARLPLPPGPVDLLVAVAGFQPQQLRAAQGEVVVRLQPWPQVELTVEAPELPAGCALFAQLGAAADDPGSYAGQWSQGSLAEYVQPPLEEVRVERGRAQLPIGDGLRRLQLQLARVDGDGNPQAAVDLADVTPTQVAAGPVAVQVPAASLQRALAALAKQQ